MVTHAMKGIKILFISPATYCDVMTSTIRDSQLMTCIGHRMLYQGKTTMATEAPMILSPLYMYVVHVFDTMGHMATWLSINHAD